MDKKLHIEKDSIQETLVIPLYARKLCTEQFPSLFEDKKAIELMDKLDYDFGALAKNSKGLVQRFGSLEIAMRQKDLEIEVKGYLSTHPRAAVVNMGCGLDQTAEICDNGKCRIYNIDMPDVIAVRNELLPPGERTENLGADLTELSWFEKINSEEGAVFFASGVFYYIDTEKALALFNAMAERFPGGKLVMDTANNKALKVMLKTFVKQSGIKNIKAYFHVDNLERDIVPYLKNIRASSRGYMLGYNELKDPSIPGFFRLLSGIGDSYMNMMILRLDFLPCAD